MGEFAIEAGKAAVNAGSGILGSAFGLLTAGINDRRQISQQSKLNDLAYQTNNKMAEEDYKRQMRLWNETNYSAQKEQLEKAGLNPGLIYGMSGGGGATTAASGGMGVSTGQAPQGGGEIINMMNQRLQMGLTQAQIKVMESQANKNNVEAEKTGGVDTQKVTTEIQSLTQGIQNAKATEILTKTQSRIAALDEQLKTATFETAISEVETELFKSNQELRMMVRENWINDETKYTKIKTIQVQLTKLLLENALTKQQTKLSTAATAQTYSNIQVNEAQIEKMATDIAQGWEKLYYDGLNLSEKERQGLHDRFINDVQQSTQIGTDMAEKIIQAITLGGILKSSPQRNPIGYK